jgi:hypothetical protein
MTINNYFIAIDILTLKCSVDFGILCTMILYIATVNVTVIYIERVSCD